MKTLFTDTLIHYFDSNNKSVLEVENNEIFEVHTKDCYGEQLSNETVLRSHIDPKLINGSTGPIHVKGAEPGDTLCVEILDIKLGEKGVMVSVPGMGTLGEHVKEMDTKILEIKNGRVKYLDGIYFPQKPMIGVIGVAPEGEKVHCAVPGAHGGNLDTNDIKIGSKVYLPVYVPGAQLAIGDLHAAMGDGEISGNGVEVSGSVIVRTTIFKNLKIDSPVIETKYETIFINSNETFEKASKECLLRATNYIMESLKLTNFNDAYRITSATCNLGVSQIVNAAVTAKVKVPRYLLKWGEFAKSKL